MASSSHSEPSAVSVMTATKIAIVETLPDDPFRQHIEGLKREQDRLRAEKKSGREAHAQHETAHVTAERKSHEFVG